MTPIPGAISFPKAPPPSPMLPQASPALPQPVNPPQPGTQEKKAEPLPGFPAEPSSAEKTSEFEKFISGGTSIRQFGYDLVSALFASGGPAKTGSMRGIRVERNCKVVTRFDLYDLLLKGDKTRNIRLMPEDVVFIPPIGSLVGISDRMETLRQHLSFRRRAREGMPPRAD